ncbi:killer cell lectin-like receptor 5 isoform X2 [Mus pahari]|uniref:killer cell lectin-like receptor 5 isoform X2 n=1 Tax=Mus pahari TaxID=10093 RepID=UPI001114C3F0|nr:killer cell lectin-like receptor 5 isoform X2 [Mus pahari]
MSEPEVTYSTVRIHKPSGLQKLVRHEKTQRPREAGYRIPWQLTVRALGILCFLLLVTVAVLAVRVFQKSEKKCECHETPNHHHNSTNMTSDIDLKEEMLRNKYIDCSSGNELLESLSRQQDKWYKETKTVLDSSQHTGRGVKYWFCYGIKCYYVIKNKNTWNGCKQNCQHYSLPFLKIDDEDELKFLQHQVIPDSYWIGLSYDKKKNEWAWIDNGSSQLDVKIRKMNFKPGGCVFLSKARLEDTNCTHFYYCICGKRLDRFPDLCSK